MRHLLHVALIVCTAAAAGCNVDDAPSEPGGASRGEDVGLKGEDAGSEGGGTPTPVRVALRAARAGSNSREEYRTNIDVESGELVQVKVLPKGGVQPRGGKVRLTIPEGPSKRLKVTAEAVGGRQRTVATMRTQGKPLKVADVRYVCRVSSKTFCPADQAMKITDGYVMTFGAPKPGTPIIVSLMAEGAR
jgi:hypothetical protein